MIKDVENFFTQRFNEYTTLPFLFVGAGLSRRYLDSNSWIGLLKEYAAITKMNEFGFELYVEDLKDMDLKVGLNPKLATMIESDFNKLWLTDEKFKKERADYGSLVKSGVSPFKLSIANSLKNKESLDSAEIQDEIALLRELKNNHVGGIITTNYDTFIENIFDDYNVYIGQNELIFSTLYGISEIYKIHGCVSSPASIVINEEDYIGYLEKNAYLAAKILTVFLEHPVVFLGYSINDSNIEAILRSIVECLNPDHLEVLKERLIFIEWNDTDKEDAITTYQKSFSNGKYLEMTHVLLKDFSILYRGMKSVKASYSAPLLRKLKEEIYELVLTSEPSNSLRVININDDDKFEDIEVVMGIGVIKSFAEKGYEGIAVKEIYEDILYDNKAFDPDQIINKALPMLLKRHSNSIPFYKYIKTYEGNLPIEIEKEVKHKIDEFLNRTLLQSKSKFNLADSSVKYIVETFPSEKALEYLCYLEEEQIEVNLLNSYLRSLWDDNPEILSDKRMATKFRRIVKIMDWLKHK
ncbi:SIR2 family protein [Chryseomicrobium palamuruense]|uniref:SIR2 family protein n=1 Tax=Chryseomicrobium palamuruense TaxID=682973 RepID=A0ABV8UWK2_9BACL